MVFRENKTIVVAINWLPKGYLGGLWAITPWLWDKNVCELPVAPLDGSMSNYWVTKLRPLLWDPKYAPAHVISFSLWSNPFPHHKRAPNLEVSSRGQRCVCWRGQDDIVDDRWERSTTARCVPVSDIQTCMWGLLSSSLQVGLQSGQNIHLIPTASTSQYRYTDGEHLGMLHYQISQNGALHTHHMPTCTTHPSHLHSCHHQVDIQHSNNLI